MKPTAINLPSIAARRARCAGAGAITAPDSHEAADATLESAQRTPRRRVSASARSDRPPVERRTHRYWRDSRIETGCISERRDVRNTEENQLSFSSDDAPDSAAPVAENKRLDTSFRTESLTEGFEDALLETGLFDFAQAERAAEIFDKIFTAAATAKATDVVREFLLSISDSKTGKTPEFRALLAIFSPQRTLEDIADEAGISRQIVHYHVKKIRLLFDAAPA